MGPGEQEVPHQHRHHGGLPRTLARLHGDALMGGEHLADVLLPVVWLGLEEVPNHLRGVFPPPLEVLLCGEFAHSVRALGAGVTSMISPSSGSPRRRASFTLSTTSSARDFPLLVTSTRFTNIAFERARASAALRRCSKTSFSSRTIFDQNS